MRLIKSYESEGWFLSFSLRPNFQTKRQDTCKKKARTSSNFGQISPLTVELTALEHKKKGDMSLVVRKPVFRVSDQVGHKPGCTNTEDG